MNAILISNTPTARCGMNLFSFSILIFGRPLVVDNRAKAVYSTTQYNTTDPVWTDLPEVRFHATLKVGSFLISHSKKGTIA